MTHCYHVWIYHILWRQWYTFHMKYFMTNATCDFPGIFRVTGLLCGEFTCPRWISRTNASDAERWWVNNREASDLRCHRAHYDVVVMSNTGNAGYGHKLPHGWHITNDRPTLPWRHNEHDGVSNHQPRYCLLNRLFRHRSKKTSKLRVTGLCAWNSPATDEFPAQRDSNTENVSIWWRHHDAKSVRVVYVRGWCKICNI